MHTFDSFEESIKQLKEKKVKELLSDVKRLESAMWQERRQSEGVEARILSLQQEKANHDAKVIELASSVETIKLEIDKFEESLEANHGEHRESHQTYS